MDALVKKGSKRSAFQVYQQLMKMEESQRESVEKSLSESKLGQDNNTRKRKQLAIPKKEKKRKLHGEEEETRTVERTVSGKADKARMTKKQSSGKIGARKMRLKQIQKMHLKQIQKMHLKQITKSSGESESEQEVQADIECSVNGDTVTVDREECAEDSSDTDKDVLPFSDQFNCELFEDSRRAADYMFKLVINPFPVAQFYKEFWEKKPLLIQRHGPDYNNGWFSTEELDTILRTNDLEFGRNIDITSYEDGKRETHNPEGRAHASIVWDFFQDGCSVRLLNPATYSNSMWLLNSTLQEHFNCCVGANVYLTPAGSQGFAPHYDDIEAFVLQLEGKKHWRVYSPRSVYETLPRHSSPNFSEGELGKPILDTVLGPGDLLYFPRGFIHQANTLPDSHSLHVTVSTYQKNTWGDMLEKLLPAALKIAMSQDKEFRCGLPRECFNYMGAGVDSVEGDPRRAGFHKKIAELMSMLIEYAPVDSAIDQMAANHIHNSLPPVLDDREVGSTVQELGSRWNSSCVEDGMSLTKSSRVKLIRYGAVRLCIDDNEVTLYHTLQNGKVYREKDLLGIQVNQYAEAVQSLLNTYPNYIAIGELALDCTNEDKVEFCHALYSQGLLMIQQ